MAPTPIDDLRYILDCDSDVTIMRRYERANSSAWVLALKYLQDSESLACINNSFMRQFLTFVYLSEVDSQ